MLKRTGICCSSSIVELVRTPMSRYVPIANALVSACVRNPDHTLPVGVMTREIEAVSPGNFFTSIVQTQSVIDSPSRPNEKSKLSPCRTGVIIPGGVSVFETVVIIQPHQLMGSIIKPNWGILQLFNISG
ncbi:hypothetical protein KAR10_01100 [bacterium]|nr:hypothetical protein [bacterium]